MTLGFPWERGHLVRVRAGLCTNKFLASKIIDVSVVYSINYHYYFFCCEKCTLYCSVYSGMNPHEYGQDVRVPRKNLNIE